MLRSGSAVGFAAALLALTAAPASAATPLTTLRYASGLSAPLWVGSPPGDKHRLFVLEQNTARIRVIVDGVLQATPYLDILSVVQPSGERGLLGLAFHPDFANNGYFYVDYTSKAVNGNPLGSTIIARYQANAPYMTSTSAQVTSATVMLGPITQPFSNHNGGCLQFGPDGYLYVGMGDGGSANDPNCNAQNKLALLGKILRIDVDNGGVAPASNPFVGDPAYADRIWALGIRNPWRFSFDRLTGDLYIGDVGQNQIEEIDFQPASSLGGENYGWRVMEGNNCANAVCNGAPACNSPLYTDPIHTYTHASGCSTTGGHVYRGCAIPDLAGTYFFADYCSATIWSFKYVGGAVTEFTNRTAELDPPGTFSIASITSFGEDACGEIYIVDQNGGEIFKIVPNAAAPAMDLGNGKVGGNGKIPNYSYCGLLSTGLSAEVRLTDAPANRAALLFVSLTQGATAVYGGTLVPGVPITLVVPLVTDANGEFNAVAPGGGGVLDTYQQWLIDDPGATNGVGFSNALKVTFQP